MDGLIFSDGETLIALNEEVDGNGESNGNAPPPVEPGEPLDPPDNEERKIPGTNIPDRGIPEGGWPNSPNYDPHAPDPEGNGVPMPPVDPPNPDIDPRGEIPYIPDNSYGWDV